MKVLPQELQAARFALTRSHAYMSSLMLSLNFVEQPGLGTMAVDKYWRCYYDPEVFKKWNPEELKSALFHECNHLLRDHHSRGEHFPNHQKMNVAADVEINPDVLASGLPVPKDWMMPDRFGLQDGMLAEEIYYHIPDDGQGGKGGQGKPGVGNGACGSCAGNPGEHELEAPGAGEGIGHAEQELIKRQVAKEIESAAKTQGNIPAGLKRWADLTLHPQVKWTKELASLARRSMIEVMGKMDRSFKRPSRVSSALGGRIVMPGWKSYIPNVGLVFDTSGSMGQTDLAKSIAEGKGVLSSLGGGGHSVTTISVDCSASAKQRVSNMRNVDLSGGGGTDMRIGLEEAASIKPRVDVVIVFTDGYTPWPSEPTRFKTIVVLTQTGAENQVPEWCKYIVVN